MVTIIKGNIPIAHRTFLSIQPLVTAMRRNTLNTLGKVKIPRANSSVITGLLRPHGQRQSRDRGTAGNSTDEQIASGNKSTVEKVL